MTIGQLQRLLAVDGFAAKLLDEERDTLGSTAIPKFASPFELERLDAQLGSAFAADDNPIDASEIDVVCDALPKRFNRKSPH